MAERAPLQVFISYAHADAAGAELARTIAEQLKQHGYDVFIDITILPGADWSQAIETALADCRLFVVLLSAASAASDMVRAEVRAAANLRKRHARPWIVPVRTAFDGKLPYELDGHLGGLQQHSWKGDANTAGLIDQLLDRLHELRDGPAPMELPSLCTLPARLGDFTGRGAALAQLCHTLTGRERRVSISAIGGMGGVGKTTLAIEAAWRVAGEFLDGVLFIDLRGFSQPRGKVQQLSSWPGLSA